MLKSHPGKLLQDHLLAVANTTRDIVAKTRTDADDTLLTVAYLIGLTHDLGKSTQYFQDHLNKGYKGVLSRHSALSSLFLRCCYPVFGLPIVLVWRHNLPSNFNRIECIPV